MKLQNEDQKPHSLFATIAAISMPGLGQIYNGQLFKGLCFYSIFLMLFLSLLKAVTCLPSSLLIQGVLFTKVVIITLYGFYIRDAYTTAKKKDTSYIAKSYNTWYFYCAIWICGSLFTGSSAFSYVTKHLIQFNSIPSVSMEPAVLQGDFIIVDRTVSARYTPHKNDIITFVYPDDRNQIYIKRVVGLPGDTIKQDSVRYTIIPHGHIYVLGDNKEHANDSRNFGPVAIRDVLGVARQVYFSIGKEGIRWKRIGMGLGPSALLMGHHY